MSCACTHPLDSRTRQREEQETAELARYVVPGVRDDELQRMAESGIDSDSLRALLFALQGTPGPEMPSGGD